ncbi:hypothetical protein F4779DRAFT_625419 [Xylariaceae sp. FL0662B]|nr:hypothetical protein F4779DRAFT_625419 [Xylariaceae sp. FL0662B]
MDHLSYTSSNSSGDESQTMGRHNAGRGHQSRRVELDLSAMLNVEQKIQLQQLINAIIDDMQKRIRENFDDLTIAAPVPSNQGIQPPKPTWNYIPNPRSEKYRDLYAGTGLDDDNSTLSIPKSAEEASKMAQKTEAEILAFSIAEIKRDALAHFGKWRVNVLRRISDIVIKNGGTGGNIGNIGGQGPQQTPGPPISSAEGGNSSLRRVYPETATPLSNFPKEKRALILHSMLLILLGLDQYATFSRTLLARIACSMHVPMFVLSQDEVRVSQALSQIIKGVPPEEIAQRRAEEGKTSRRWKAGTGGSAAAAVPNGVNSGLAPPLAASGIGTVFGGIGLSPSTAASLLGSMAESTIAVGTLFGLYGARQGGKTMDAYAKDIQDFAMMPLHGTHKAELVDPKDVPVEDRRLRVTIGIGGWFMDQDGFIDPWRALGQQNEVYTMRWEPEALTKIGTSLETVVKSSAWSLAKKEAMSRNVFASLKEAFWPIGLLKVSKIIDNPWCVGMVRAEKAGLVLADILINKIYGERPITLIGYSLGARIIYSCLIALAEKRAFGIVENVVIMGAPCPTEIRAWAAIRSVVAGRLINVYSANDYILGFLYRSSNWHYGVAGLQRVQGVPNVENFDVSDIVSNHLRYQYLVGSVLRKLGWGDIDDARVTQDAQKLAELISQERKLDKERNVRKDVNLNKEAQKVKDAAKTHFRGSTGSV